MVSNAQAQKGATVPIRWLVVIRLLWIALFLLTLVCFVLGVYARFQRLERFCIPAECGLFQLTAGEIDALWQLGISHHVYTWCQTAITSIVGAAYLGTAAILFWRRSNHWMTIFVASGMFMMPLLFYVSVVDALIQLDPVWYLPASVVRATGLWFAILFGYLFPDGHFVPVWTRPLALVATVTAAASVLYATWSLDAVWRADTPLGPLFSVLLASLWGSGLLAQVIRYRFVSSAAERQQTKWMVLGLVALMLEINVFALLGVLVPSLNRPGLARALYYLIGSAINALFLFFWLATGVIVVLRYRLWEVDVIIRRTLVYTALSALLALGYLGGIALFESIFRGLTGQGNSDFAIVLSTLAMATLFFPLRHLIQNGIDRRFYRRRYNEAQVVASFTATARHETDQDRLTAALAHVIQETLQPTQVSLWLRSVQMKQKDR